MSIPYREWAHADCQFLAAHGDDNNGNNWNVYDEWDDSNFAPTLKIGQKRISSIAYDVWTVNVRPDGDLVEGANIGVYAKIGFTVTLDTNNPTLTTFRLMKGPCYHSNKWNLASGTGRYYDGTNQWSSYPIYDLSSYSGNDFCDSPADIVVSTLPSSYVAYIPALNGSDQIIFGGDPDIGAAGYPCQDELFKNGYWLESSNFVDAGGDHNPSDWSDGHEFSVALSAFTIKVYFFNPVVNSTNITELSEAGGDSLVLTGMGFDNSDADIEQGGVGAGSGRAGGWVDDVYEIDIIGQEGQGTTTITSVGGDFTVDSNTQITITSPALSVGTYHLCLWKDRDGTRHEVEAVVSAYAGDWTTDAGGKMTEGTRTAFTVGSVSSINYRWRYFDSSSVFQNLWKMKSTTSIVLGNLVLNNIKTGNDIWTAKLYDDDFVLHTQVEVENKIRFLDGMGGYAGFKSGLYTSSVDYTLPVADGSAGQVLSTDGAASLKWETVAKGNVIGPASSTDNAVVRFDTATGKLIQNSVCLLDDSGLMLLAETANADMTIGLTINQAGNDDEIFALKSSDVAHGFTTYTETDTYFSIKKTSATGGGVLINGLSDTDITTSSFTIRAATKYTGYTGAGLASSAIIQMQGVYGSGTTRSAAQAGMNVFLVRTYDNSSAWASLFIIKESGNANLKGTLSAPDVDFSAPSKVYDLSHDSFADYVANKHIDHTGVTLTAGTGLTGGGTIAANRTFNVDVGIADNKIAQIDHAAVADNDYAKFTAAGLEGRSYSETLGDIGGASKTTAAWSKSIGSGGDYATWAAMIAAMPDLIAHAVTVTIKTGTTLTETCNLKNKHGLTTVAAITIRAEKYFPTSGAIPTADSATATTLRDAALATAALGDDYFNGCWVFVVDGTGTDNGFVPITDYVDATGDVVVASWPGTQPDNTSRYLILGALIDGGSARSYGFFMKDDQCPLLLYGVGIKDCTAYGMAAERAASFVGRYIGAYNTTYSGLYFAYCRLVDVRYSGLVNNNTANNSGHSGIKLRGDSLAYILSSGFSDNSKQGILLEYGGASSLETNFGDANGLWGTYARYSAQAKIGGAECSGSSGNHSDPGTAGTANADQAAVY